MVLWATFCYYLPLRVTKVPCLGRSRVVVVTPRSLVWMRAMKNDAWRRDLEPTLWNEGLHSTMVQSLRWGRAPCLRLLGIAFQAAVAICLPYPSISVPWERPLKAIEIPEEWVHNSGIWIGHDLKPGLINVMLMASGTQEDSSKIAWANEYKSKKAKKGFEAPEVTNKNLSQILGLF